MSQAQIKFVAWLVLTIMAGGATAITYAFSTFETKEHVHNDISTRLDRIENKLDQALSRQ